MAEVDTVDVIDAAAATRTVATTSKLLKSIGLPTDAKASTSDATSITQMQVLKQLSFSLQALVAVLKAEDAASAGADLLMPMGAIQNTTPADTAGTDGDYASPQMKNGRLWMSAILEAGLLEIGKVSVKHFNVAGSTLTRPANMTAYTANDSVSDNATAGSVTANTVTVSDTNDDPIDLTEILLDTTDTGPGTAGALMRVHIFNADPTASTGVVGGDNAAWSNKKANWIGSFSGIMVAFSDGSKGTLISDGCPVRIGNVESGGKRLWYQVQTLSNFTPSANSTTFSPRFKGYQGRT